MKQVFSLISQQIRQNTCQAVMNAPEGYQVTIAQKTRTLDQNSLLWAKLTEISRTVVWHGQKLTPENWKDIFTAALKRQAVVPGLDGGFVVLGTSTRRMTKGEMSDLIELMNAFQSEQAA